MALLREYFWLFIVFGIIFVSMFLGLLFIFINKCITRRAQQFQINAQQSANHGFYAENSQYHPKQLEEELPPLPARNPSWSSCTSDVSYEDVHDQPDYVKVEENAAPSPYQSAAAAPVQTEACSDRYSVSTEAYDDVVLSGYESEDYDDVA